MEENIRTPRSGGMGCLGIIAGLAACVAAFIQFHGAGPRALAVLGILALLFMSSGFLTLEPNEASVLQLFGAYAGTVKTDGRGGLFWINPFYSNTKVSLRVQNFESAQLKVNDHDGNPIEIAAIIAFRLKDTAQAAFAVSDYKSFVKFQTEAALRNLATRYPYDAHQDGQRSLRGDTAEVAVELKREVQEHLGGTGIEIMDGRISHLAYAPEIAAAMLQRQQASALIAARQRIVEGAVGMVDMALKHLAERKVVELDAAQKARLVSNLLVVLCSHSAVQPVLNTGSAKP